MSFSTNNTPHSPTTPPRSPTPENHFHGNPPSHPPPMHPPQMHAQPMHPPQMHPQPMHPHQAMGYMTFPGQMGYMPQPGYVMQPMQAPPPPKQDFVFRLPVRDDCVGLVVGKAGATIKRLQSETGARCNLKPAEPEKNRPLPHFQISGNPVSVTRLAVRITEIAYEAKTRNDTQP